MSTVSPQTLGTGLIKYIKALGNCEGNLRDAIQRADQERENPSVLLTLKAAVDPLKAGSNPLVAYGLSTEFYELFRSASIVGRLTTQFRRVPFMTQIPVEEDSLSYPAWVPEGNLIPVRAFTFDETQLPICRMAMISILNRELLRMSTPSADSTIRQILVGAVAQFVDSEFLGDDAAVEGERPAGICSGAETHSSSGATAANIMADVSAMGALLESWKSPVWVMPSRTYMHIAALDLIKYPGPLLAGFPVYHSTASPSQIVLLDAAGVILADDGESRIDLSENSTIQMGDGGSPETEETLSLFENNLVAFRVQRYISWSRPVSSSVVVMDVAY
jgi:HK97 family phage major capsid protein